MSIDWYGSEYSAVTNRVSCGVTGSSSRYTTGWAGSVASTVTASGECRHQVRSSSSAISS